MYSIDLDRLLHKAILYNYFVTHNGYRVDMKYQDYTCEID
jgi:hypothetical protein